jgi:alkanesulfonate monooxygenase SsuD/methylene tetrahydromethanopterin reductase-like flavin-dependent oxidoreductase (luciferase family)
MAMEPKPPQGAQLPIWVGGTSQAALRRVGRLGDGWMGSARSDDASVKSAMVEIARYAEDAGRDPAKIGMQLMLAPPPSDAAGKAFYNDHDRVLRRAEAIRDLGVEWTGVNATAIFQAGARSVSAMIDELGKLHGRLRETVG